MFSFLRKQDNAFLIINDTKNDVITDGIQSKLKIGMYDVRGQDKFVHCQSSLKHMKSYKHEMLTPNVFFLDSFKTMLISHKLPQEKYSLPYSF